MQAKSLLSFQRTSGGPESRADMGNLNHLKYGGSLNRNHHPCGHQPRPPGRGNRADRRPASLSNAEPFPPLFRSLSARTHSRYSEAFQSRQRLQVKVSAEIERNLCSPIVWTSRDWPGRVHPSLGKRHQEEGCACTHEQVISFDRRWKIPMNYRTTK